MTSLARIVTGPDDAPTLVLLHGITGSAVSLAEAIDHCVGRGYRVVAVDARGHGLSPRWESAELERAGEVLVEDLIAVLEDLEAASRGRAALGLPTPPAPAGFPAPAPAAPATAPAAAAPARRRLRSSTAPIATAPISSAALKTLTPSTGKADLELCSMATIVVTVVAAGWAFFLALGEAVTFKVPEVGLAEAPALAVA